MKKSLLLLFALLLTLAGKAQSPASNRVHIKYVEDKWLAANGSDLFLVTLDLEWPQQLAGHDCPALQSYLSELLFGQASTSLRDALASLKTRTGERIQQMPDGDMARHYIDAKTYVIWQEAGRYVSMVITASETDGMGKAQRRTHQYFTYDIPGDRVLSREMVFNESNLSGQYDQSYRVIFENALAENAVCNANDMQNVDLTKLPNDFALFGKVMLFGLGGNPEHNNYSTTTLEALETLNLTSRKFRKWMAGESKEKKGLTSDVAHPESHYDLETRSDLPDLPEEKAMFPGGQDSLYAYLRQHVAYPQAEYENNIEGRVIVSCIVGKDGSLDEFTVVRSVSPALDREAIRVFRSMPRWTPARNGGEAVCNRVTFPLLFKTGMAE